MKIAIPVEDNQTEICPSFGRTSMFLIYDTEKKEKKAGRKRYKICDAASIAKHPFAGAADWLSANLQYRNQLPGCSPESKPAFRVYRASELY